MSTVALPAHLGGQQIVLDAFYPLEPSALLAVTVLSAQNDEEHAEWLRFSIQNFAVGYGDDEPEYWLDDITVAPLA